MTLSKFYLAIFLIYYLLILLFGNMFLKSGFNPQALLLMISLAYIMFNINFYIKLNKKNKLIIIFGVFILYSVLIITLSIYNFVSLFKISGIVNRIIWIPRQAYFIIFGLVIGSALYRSLLFLKDSFIFKYRNLMILLFLLLLFIFTVFKIGEMRVITVFFPVLIYSIYTLKNKYLGIILLFLSFFFNVFNSFSGDGSLTGFFCLITILLFVLMNNKHILEFKKHIYGIFFFVIFMLFILGIYNLNFLKNLDVNTWWRLSFWRDEIDILAKTYFFGVGFGSPYYSHSLNLIAQLWTAQSNIEYGYFNTPFIMPQHNSFMNIFYRLGIIGFILFILFNFYIFKYFKTSLKKYKANKIIYNNLRIILLGFILSIINILFNPGLESPRVFISYLLFVSLSMAYNTKILYKEKYEITK